ncbi:ribonuclease H2 subunit B [Impatiens glandulifera]|uniref:ribonuclease H2 subunit B n=1 Tax=Impatiens glandulifera TaxID=253017 RepID=UPI001FB07A4B|nr:ribonuclease H2 subunit B [Impatiens glandulifera]
MTWWEGFNETRLLVGPDPGGAENRIGQFLPLLHPKSGNKTCYLFVNGELQELSWFKQAYGSWFLGNYVCEDGGLYTATPVDPVFVLLPIFDNARMKREDDPGKFRQLDEILFINGYPAYQQLSSIAEKSIEVVCDVKEIGCSKFFRLNDSKVLSWMVCKVNQLKQAVLALDKNYAAQDDKKTLADAISILGEYLKDEPWLKMLQSHLKLDLQEMYKATPDVETHQSTTADGPALFSPSLEKSGIEKKAIKNTRQNKRIRDEGKSQNIRSMFTRAAKKGT